MKNFDQFIGIDWSGAKTPVRTKSIAFSIAWRGHEAPHLSGRTWSRSAIAEYLEKLAFAGEKSGKRTLVGIDANFGYAQEVGVRQFGPDYDYRDLWNTVEAANIDEPNYFAGGFWTHPDYAPYFWAEGKKPAHVSLPKRKTEMACGEAGYGWPESPFKLLGPKQVGKGGLAAMRMALDLKKRCGDLVAIWPFERDLADETARLVVTEIYPRQFLRRAGHGNAKIRTTEELNVCLAALGSEPVPEDLSCSDHEADALTAAAGLRFLCGEGENVPELLATPPAMDDNAARREGWIFGAGDYK